MSDQTQGGGDANSPDPLTNVKAEVGRKITNLETQIAAMAEANKALLSQVQAMVTAPKAPQTPVADDLEDLWYKDPKAAAAQIVDRTEARIEQKFNARQEAATKQSQTIASLVRDYPELNDENNALTRRAVELYNAMDASEKVSPMAYKLAVKDAASELEVKPMSRRATSDDSYSMGSYGSQAQAGQRQAKRGELAPETVAFAKLVGLNLEDPNTLQSLKNKAQRKNWNRYE